MKRYALVLAVVMVAVLFATAVTMATPKKPQSKAKVKVKISSPAKAAKKNKPAKPSAQAKLPKLVDLGAEKCIPCKMMVPVLDELRKDYKGKLEVVFIDVWQNRNAAEEYKIRAIPTQIFYDKDGRELIRHEGYIPREDIIKVFKEKGVKL